MVAAKDEDYDPSKVPALKLWGHIMQKGWQAGSVVGSLGVGPGMGAYATFVKKGQFDVLQLTEGAAYGVLGGLALTGVVGALKILQMDREGIEDRVYRLHYNDTQKRTDLFAAVGGAFGLAAAGYFLPKYSKSEVKPINYLGGAGLGTVLGILVHMATRPIDNTPSKMLHELRY